MLPSIAEVIVFYLNDVLRLRYKDGVTLYDGMLQRNASKAAEATRLKEEQRIKSREAEREFEKEIELDRFKMTERTNRKTTVVGNSGYPATPPLIKKGRATDGPSSTINSVKHNKFWGGRSSDSEEEGRSE